MNNDELRELLDYLKTQGYHSLRNGPDDKPCGLFFFLFTVAIVVGLDRNGYSHRYCYNTWLEAESALKDWAERGYSGEPEGYIVRKGLGADKQGASDNG